MLRLPGGHRHFFGQRTGIRRGQLPEEIDATPRRTGKQHRVATQLLHEGKGQLDLALRVRSQFRRRRYRMRQVQDFQLQFQAVEGPGALEQAPKSQHVLVHYQLSRL